MENKMLQRMSDQHKISFLDGEKPSDTPKKPEEKQKATIQQTAEAQKAKRLQNKDDGLMTPHTISSARTGAIGNQGGPSKYTKSETSNTMWDSERTSRMAEDNKEKTIREKDEIATNRRHAEKQRMDDLVEVLKSTDQTKASAIAPAGTYQGSSYKPPVNNMSIFDSKDFERLPEKTAGEQVTEDNVDRKNQKDDSWRGGGKSINTKEVVSEYFNELLKKKEQ